MRVADPLVIVTSGLAAHYLRIGTLVPSEAYAVVIVLGALLAANFLAFGGSYRVAPESVSATNFLRGLLIWLVAIGVLLAGLFLAKVSVTYSRGFVVYWVVLAGVLLIANRVVLLSAVSVMKQRGGLKNRVAVLGSAERAQSVIERLYRSNTDLTYVVGGFVGDECQMPHIQDRPVFGTIAALRRMVERGRVDEILMCFDHHEKAAFRSALDTLSASPVNVTCTTGSDVDDLPIIGTGQIGGLFVLRLSDRPLSGWNGVVKNIEDKVLAALLLVAVAPLMLVVAGAVKLSSPGPVFFRQMRYGFNNKSFEVFKFRTMRTHEESEDFLRQATEDDPRITAIGGFLRRTSLDELPQLINVLQGTMSLVGPRPHAVSHNDYYQRLSRTA
ncbi:MAG: exopolysaccharide biosynthesis polyprenyl glycosylphosphotransferase [Proteobacteria bacterium]|nr:exopolysaccharide biosynthesis polyprenyl glycosylphosphotransferase [Pseudomonadota bacterium]